MEARSGPGYLLPAAKAGPEPGIYAVDGPRRLRPLPVTELVAVSPDGRRAVGTWRQGDSPPTLTRVVDVATGRVLAEARLSLEAPGAWTGDRVVAPFGRRGARLALVHVGARELVVERQLRLPRAPEFEAHYGIFLRRPVAVGDGEHDRRPRPHRRRRRELPVRRLPHVRPRATGPVRTVGTG